MAKRKEPQIGEKRMMYPKSLYPVKKTGPRPKSMKRPHVYAGKMPVSYEHKHGKQKYQYRDDMKTKEEEMWVPLSTWKHWMKSAKKTKP